MNKLVIIGASGHGKVVADIAEKSGYTDIVFLDDDPTAGVCDGYAVIGGREAIRSLEDSNFIVAIGNAEIRRKLQSELIEMGLHIVSLIHPSAVVARDVKIGVGTVVMAGAVINPNTEIGRGCIINTCSSVDHDCRVGDYVHIAVGAHVCGAVMIGDGTWIGAGATVSNNVEIAEDCMIGAGAVVVKDIGESSVYIGVPAQKRGGGVTFNCPILHISTRRCVA